jgi:hypothetical protein
MKADELRARLSRVKASSVKVVFSAKKLSAGRSKTGLWPRVTLSCDGREETIALTEYGEVKLETKVKKQLSKLEIAILRIAGVESRAMRAAKDKHGVQWELMEAERRVRSRISSAVSKAQTTRRLSTRIEGEQRKQRKHAATARLEQTFRDLLSRTVKLNDLTGSQVARVWERVKMEVVVKEVHDL